jgi:hypothetical protein
VTTLYAQQPGTPAPQPSRLSQPYWDGCRHGELRFMICGVCGTAPAIVELDEGAFLMSAMIGCEDTDLAVVTARLPIPVPTDSPLEHT